MLPFRRKRSFKRRLTDAFRKAPKRGRKLRAAAAELDVPWARSAPARFVRERTMQFVLNPVMDYYAARQATGKEKLSALKGPVMIANCPPLGRRRSAWSVSALAIPSGVAWLRK